MTNLKAQSSDEIQSPNIKSPQPPPLLKGGKGGLMIDFEILKRGSYDKAFGGDSDGK